MNQHLLSLSNSEAILYYPGRRLIYLLIVAALLHVFILLTVDFAPIIKAIKHIKEHSQRAVSISLEKSAPPTHANYLGLFDHAGSLDTEPQGSHTFFFTPVVKYSIENTDKIIALQGDDFTLSYTQTDKATPMQPHMLRRKIISAAAHQHEDAAYLYRWQQYIEAVGSEFYPQEALQKNITGKVRLLVALNKEGQVQEVVVRQSSGSTLLDAAALAIVKKAQPFEPIPISMLQEHDRVEIIRTWDFRGSLKIPS
ncbi:TonB family protein [Candidatus Berkiella cookevillensis]|nr:energy transducer TonB [Candidatus Berkiella cookevillensis]MCS5707420.1 TonB family protein [Candidatus Berkiella cookevillensis]